MTGTKCICNAGLPTCDGNGTGRCPVTIPQRNVGEYRTATDDGKIRMEAVTARDTADSWIPSLEFEELAIKLCGELSSLFALLPPMHKYELDDIAFHLRAIQNIIYARKTMRK